jgi:hypothetical protein
MREPTSKQTPPARRSLRTLAAVLLFAVAWAWAATAARADHLNVALGSDGQLYSVQAGTYGALFPGQSALAPATPVLALDTIVPGAAPQRQLVQSTDDADLESSPALIYEDVSQTLFVVWVAQSQSANSVIKLASFDGTNWSPSITIISNPYATKTAPQLALTRDSHQETTSSLAPPPSSAGNATTPAANPPTLTLQRTILHVVWSEDSATGLYQSYYVPIIFENGTWIGAVPEPVHLNAYDALEQAPHTPAGGPFGTPLVYAPNVEGGRDASTVVLGFASETSGMVTAVEADMLPEELRIVADAASAAILNNGGQYFPDQLGSIATLTQNAIQSTGTAFQPEVLQAIISSAKQQVMSGSNNLPTLALRTRATIVDTGAKFSTKGLKPVVPTSGVVAPSQIIEIVTPTGPSQFIQFRVASTRPFPPIGITGVQLFLSATGYDALAAWTSATGTSVLYTNTQPDGTWSRAHQVLATSSMPLQQIYTILEQRIHP